MFGAIIGDIIGSVYEWNSIKTKDFPLFRHDCFFTDDTVMTIATAEALMDGGETENFINAYKKWGRLYPDIGYGARFEAWFKSDDRNPYNSWGNGSAMRVSPCAYYAFRSLNSAGQIEDSINHARQLATISASVTHNHPEGIKGAEATVYCMMLAYAYGEKAKKHIRDKVPNLFGYDLTLTLDEIRPTYRFNSSCQASVPQAIIAFLESTDFEDAIRNAISLGGDSDTQAAITGSIAEAAYGVPREIKEKAMTFLDAPILDVCLRWERFIGLLKII
jgi:ADP-ribosylglycohydrolase